MLLLKRKLKINNLLLESLNKILRKIRKRGDWSKKRGEPHSTPVIMLNSFSEGRFLNLKILAIGKVR